MFNVRSKYVILPTSPNKMAESKSGFRLRLLSYARSVAKHCDWNQAPGCQRETPQIEGKTPQIEEKSSFRSKQKGTFGQEALESCSLTRMPLLLMKYFFSIYCRKTASKFTRILWKIRLICSHLFLSMKMALIINISVFFPLF